LCRHTTLHCVDGLLKIDEMQLVGELGI